MTKISDWQAGEREIFVRCLPRLIAVLGTKPDHVDDVLCLERLHTLLSLRTSPPPSGEAGEVKVKPLEWQFEGGTFSAKSVAGRYSIIRRDGDWLCLHEGLSVGYFDDGSIDPVKAAAQSDYETRIRSALLPTIKEPTDGK